jgi:branched-chain amino acid transport system ATP-binding protein
MVAIGRALMAAPRLLIFDELSLGLAPQTIDRLYEALGQLRGWGVSLILIEQNVYRALALADRVYVLERGRISYSGPPADLRHQPTLLAAYFGLAGGVDQREEARRSQT